MAEVTRPGSASCFGPHTANMCSSGDNFSGMLFAFLLVTLLFKVALRQSTEVLSSAAKCKKGATWPTAKTHV